MSKNDFDLSILPVKPSNNIKKLKRELHPNLPDISTGQLGILISPVKTGKSTIISNLLLNKNFYAELFDVVYIISNTIHNDETSRFLKEQFPETIWDEYSDNIIENIVNYQKTFPKGKQPFIALILDDFLGIKSKSQIYNLATRFRHYNIGLLLFASQLFRGLPSVIRQNATFAIMGGPNPNNKELLKMSEEFGARYNGDKHFLKLYKEATKKRYNFLYLDLQSNPSKAFRNFTDLIYENTSNQDLNGITDQDDAENDE